MYEPIRTKSVHSMAEPTPDFPHRTREEELDVRLAGHLTALLTVTDELRAHTPHPGLDDAAQRLAEQAARLRDGRAPLRAAPSTTEPDAAHIATLHQRAHTLAGWALVVATSRNDTAASTLAAERLAAHAAALGLNEA
ncbi:MULTISPECIES: SCO4983 family protein [Streptomyces]|uniref:Uncharacterized protein n=1 Tax=Streptomyces mordarskii TaxID=1226758 RepID=A0ABN1DYV4_9ACTN|nr:MULTISPECIES: hypothetical protein [Streptomyces]QTI89202.1 hypothetical protein AS97_52300 [Streptomyces sp. AgN23]RSS39862.1 hypothetical protein EF902_26440 [Streptomyces sp. WAC05858]WTA83705.1 hypothetical protein OG751_29625 [Streptomyces antimycoticus]WTB05858.1 hypothetical protein OG546_17475 [Streptomyces antimycoticus]